MDRLDAMRLFVRIMERRSFTLAAQDLGLPRSTVTETVKQLEARLGTRLLQRTTRHVSPTLDGEAFHHRCLGIIADIEDAEAAFSTAKPRGLLRVHVHAALARQFLLPGLPAFLAQYPDLELQIGEGDRLIDPVREGYDCVLRVGEMPDSGLVGRRVALLDEVTCTGPDYIARHGVPQSIEDLHKQGHRMIAFISSITGSAIPLDFTLANGRAQQIMLPATVSVNGAETYKAAARLGLGLIQVPRYGVAEDLAHGRLVQVLPQHPPAPSPVQLLYPHSRHLAPRARVFIAWLTQAFAQREREQGPDVH